MLIGTLIVFGACNNAPSPEDVNLIKQGNSATLLNKFDPEQLRIKKLVKQYEELIESKIKENNLPGVAYAIVKDGQVISMKTYGVCSVEKQEPIDEHTVFNLASVSKGFASVLTGVMVDKGYIDWNDKIKTHLPKFQLKEAYHTENLTIRHCLSHCTGIKEYTGADWISRNMPFSAMVKNLRKATIVKKPQQVFGYQNVVYSLIGEVGKAITKLSYETLLDSMLFNPLGMADASASFKDIAKNKNKAMPHIYNSKKKAWQSDKISPNWYNVGPAAGVNASISDMAIWLQTMLGHRPEVVPHKVLHEIFKPHIAMNDDHHYYTSWSPGLAQASYGMGWRIFDYNNNRIVYHGGFISGYRPEMGFCPKEDVGIVFLTNSSHNEVSSLCVRSFFDMYFAPKIGTVEQ